MISCGILLILTGSRTKPTLQKTQELFMKAIIVFGLTLSFDDYPAQAGHRGERVSREATCVGYSVNLIKGIRLISNSIKVKQKTVEK